MIGGPGTGAGLARGVGLPVIIATVIQPDVDTDLHLGIGHVRDTAPDHHAVNILRRPLLPHLQYLRWHLLVNWILSSK